mgnify:FL=1
MSSLKVEVNGRKFWAKDLGARGVEVHDLNNGKKSPRNVVMTLPKRVSTAELENLVSTL